MFPHRNFVQTTEESDEEYDASLQFSKKAKELLRSIAPTREERATRSVSKGAPPLQAIRKKLNFDESFTFEAPSIARQKCQLAEYEEQLEKLRRTNKTLENEVQHLTQRNEELNSNVADLRSTVSNLKQQLVEGRSHQDESMCLNDSILDRIRHGNICTVAQKYITWFNCAMDQLRITESILLENKLMTAENKNKLLKARPAAPIEMDTDDIAAYAVGSFQDFPLLQSLQHNEQLDVSSDSCVPPPSEVKSFSALKPILLSPIANESDQDRSDLLNTTIANSSICSVDIGHKERIAYLEQQNSMLLDKLKIASYRAQTALVLEEEKRSLESRIRVLNEKLDTAMAELAHFRKNQVDGMFQKIPDGNEFGQALTHVDKVARLEIRCEQLNNELNKTNGRWKENEEYISKLKECISNRDAVIDSLNSQLQNSNLLHEDTKKNLDSVTIEYNRLNQLLENQKNIITNPVEEASCGDTAAPSVFGSKLTDAGNTTQIFHLVDNPLSQAHRNLAEEERVQKRKASDSLSNEDPKRSREDDIDRLQKQLNKAEKEREVTLKIHDDTLLKMKKYREFTTSLTGCQIKVTDFDEGLVAVSSIYDDNNKQFVFKVGYQNVDLLDVDSGSSSNSYNWNKEAEHYIGERSSVPGFLAKVTLTLETQRELESTERTHMFSVLHE